MAKVNIPHFSEPLTDRDGRMSAAWTMFFSNAVWILLDVQNSGTTAQRPTKNLYTGKPYFDTTLGKPIWYKTAGWVDATGGSV